MRTSRDNSLGLASLRRGAPGRWGRPGAIAGVVLGAADYLVLLVMISTRLSGAGFHGAYG